MALPMGGRAARGTARAAEFSGAPSVDSGRPQDHSPPETRGMGSRASERGWGREVSYAPNAGPGYQSVTVLVAHHTE